VTDCDLPIQYEPQGRTFVTHRIGSPEKARREIGFEWKTDLEDGLRNLIEWRRADQRREARPVEV
jgi:UDP-glucose 4-epimerase